MFDDRPRVVTTCTWLTAALYLGLLPAVGSPAAAQDEPAAAPKAEEITAEVVESRTAQIKEQKDLDDAVRTRLRDLYRQTAEHLKRATDHAAQEAENRRLTAEVPERQQTIRVELDGLKSRTPATFPKRTPLAELEQELAQREAKFLERKRELARLDGEPKRRANRRKEIRTLVFSAPERWAEIRKQLEAPPPADELPLLTAARRAELLARRKALEQEVSAFQSELALYDAAEAVDLVRLSRDLLAQQTALEEQELRALGELVNRRRLADAEQNVRQARMDSYSTHPLLRPYAERNRALAEEAQQVTRQSEAADEALKRARAELEQVRKDFINTREKVTSIGLTGPIGLLLRKQRSALPDARRCYRSVAEREEVINAAHLAIFEFDDERSRLANPEPLVREIVAEAGTGLNDCDCGELELAAGDVLDKQREYLDSLNRSYSAYFDTLVELDKTERQVIRETESFANYIDSRVLWIRSGTPLTPGELRRDRESWRVLFDAGGWIESAAVFWADTRGNPVPPASGLLLFGALYYLRRRVREEFGEIAAQTSRSTCSRFGPTVRAVVLTALMAAPWPVLLWVVAWRLNALPAQPEFAKALATALHAVATLWLPLEAFRQVCRPNGLAVAHFDWSDGAVRLLRVNLRLLILVGLPIALAGAMLAAGEMESGRGAVERLVFAVGMVVLAGFVGRTLHPVGGVFQELIAYNRGGWIDRLKHFWYALGVLAPLALAGLAVAGYYYTAQHLAGRLYSTIALVVLLIVLRSLLLRWVLVYRRRLSIAQARERRAAAESASQGEEGTAGMPQPAEPPADLAFLSYQTQRLLNTGLVAAALVGFWLVWVDVLPALSVLDRWPLWYTSTQVTEEVRGLDETVELRTIERTEAITLASVLLAVLIGAMTIIGARNFPGLLEMWLLQRLPLDASVRYAITSLASYAIVILGVVIGGSTIGLSWSKIQWLATALTFGLAFGLQEIFANFVAGLIILFERPIRVGDVVTIADVTGVVSRIRIRATTITTWDRKEFIVPNKEFITGRLLNWTLSDTINRIEIAVGVAYGTDTELVRDLLVKAAAEHPIVLTEPAPNATFDGFRDSSLHFTLRLFLPGLEHRLPVTHELHSTIHRTFREHDIEIAFPQRDLHIRNLPAALAGAKERAA